MFISIYLNYNWVFYLLDVKNVRSIVFRLADRGHSLFSGKSDKESKSSQANQSLQTIFPKIK
jgi:hypothetical protein